MKDRIEIYKDSVGEYRFRVKAANNEVVAHSEGYKTKGGCRHGAKVMRRVAVKSLWGGFDERACS